MSDDDERMERAKRIRRMREGQRSASEDDGTESTDDDGDEATASDRTVPESGSDQQDGADEQRDDTAEPDTDSPDQPDETTGQPTRADGAEQSQVNSMNESTSASETDESSGMDEESPDPQAIAERAAQAAASVAGGGSTAAESGGGGDVAAEESDLSVEEAAAAIQGSSGVELPDQETLEAAIESADGSVEPTGEPDAGIGRGPSSADSAATSTAEDSTRVLEFTLGDEHYCIDISLVEEIVKRDSITRVPNTDDYIEGVVDLRGQITTILNPKHLLDIDAEGPESLMIVFDPDAFDDQGAIGWVVDAVRQVAPIRDSEVNDPPVNEEYIHGVVDRDDGEDFVIWTKPEIAIKLATVERTDD